MKSLTNWLEQTEKNTTRHYEQYADAFSDPSCSPGVRDKYAVFAQNNFSLHQTLAHIKRYGSFHSNNCPLCVAQEAIHIKTHRDNYQKYRKFIGRFCITLN